MSNYTCPTICVETNHPGCEHDEWRPDGWVEKPWPEERYPTVDEWIDWFIEAPRGQQQAEVAMFMRDAETAIRCLVLHPPTQPASQQPAAGIESGEVG